MLVKSIAGTKYFMLWRHMLLGAGTRQAALDFLHQAGKDPAGMADLRTVLRSHYASSPIGMGDEEVIDTLATLVAKGELIIAWDKQSSSGAGEGDQASSAEQPSPAPRASSSREQEPDPDTFPPNHDGSRQAATLRTAAQTGVPFCEECAKAAQAGAA